MSRGIGKVQRAILELIAGDDDGAWTTTDICWRVYTGINRVEKKHRVAVSRGLRTMALPETWSVVRRDRQGNEYILFNRLSLESTTRRKWISHTANGCTFEQFKKHYGHMVDKASAEVTEYRVYYDADEVGRVDYLIRDAQKRAGVARQFGLSGQYFAAIVEEISRLQKRKADLEAAKINVSAPSRLRDGNTYPQSDERKAS